MVRAIVPIRCGRLLPAPIAHSDQSRSPWRQSRGAVSPCVGGAAAAGSAGQSTTMNPSRLTERSITNAMMIGARVALSLDALMPPSSDAKRLWGAGHPKVNEKASTPGSRNSISNSRSAIGFGCRIS